MRANESQREEMHPHGKGANHRRRDWAYGSVALPHQDRHARSRRIGRKGNAASVRSFIDPWSSSIGPSAAIRFHSLASA